jgi:hypothetical protein
MYRFSRAVLQESRMPRNRKNPAYRLHKARNCAVVTIHGKNQYLRE